MTAGKTRGDLMNNNHSEQPASGQPIRTRRGCLGWLGRIAIGALALLAIALIAGAIYQSASSASDLAKYPPPGQMIGVGGHRLHLNCSGEGAPTVILEAGASSVSLGWYRIQTEVAKFARVCSYDRAGFGWSDPVSGGRPPDQVAEELHALLAAANVTGPYVLVGHSAGGLYVRAYAAQYPSDVAGMVLVDSSSEGQAARFPPEVRQMSDSQTTQIQICQALSPFGLIRMLRILDAAAPESSGPGEVRAAALSTMYRTSYCGAAVEELQALAPTMNESKPARGLGDLPLIVLTAGVTAEQQYAQLPESARSLITLDMLAQVSEAHQEMQLELVALSTRGKQVIATESGHSIQWDQPDLVIDAIHEVVDQVRGD